MKKLSYLFGAVCLLAGCTIYSVLPKQIDKQKIAAISYASDSIQRVTVLVQKPDSIHGIPHKARLPHKSQYVVPLLSLDFLGAMY